MDKSDLNELKNMLSGLEASIMAKVDEKLDKITTKSEQKTEKKQKYRRRKQKEKETSGFDVGSLDLTAAERKELAQASKSDKQNNVHVQRERLQDRDWETSNPLVSFSFCFLRRYFCFFSVFCSLLVVILSSFSSTFAMIEASSPLSMFFSSFKSDLSIVSHLCSLKVNE